MVRVVYDGDMGSSGLNYSNSAIQRRTGLSRKEVEDIRSEGNREVRERGRGFGGKKKAGGGRGSVGFSVDKKGGIRGEIGFGGFGVGYGSGGNGYVSFPGGIRVDYSDQGCYIVSVHSFLGQRLFSNIQKKRSCEEDDRGGSGGSGDDLPPHCTGSDGKRGTGSPQNLYPPCAVPGVTYEWYFPVASRVTRNLRENTQTQGAWTDEEGALIWDVSPMNAGERPKYLQKNTTEYFYVEPHPQAGESETIVGEFESSGNPAFFRGTQSELEEHLMTRWNVPRQEDNSTDSNKWGHPEIVKASYWVSVYSPELEDCTPTTDQGCGDSSGDPAEKDRNKPEPPGKTGERNPPDRPTNRRDEDEEMDCCANIKKIAKALSVEQFPTKIPRRWIERNIKQYDEEIELETMHDMMQAMGLMLDRFEELFNPTQEEAVFPMHPEQGSFFETFGVKEDYKYPDPNFRRDPGVNRRIKENRLYVRTYRDIFKYTMEAVNRLETIFPIAEIEDSEIDKGLLYPKHTGTYKIYNMIQMSEVIMLYLNNVLGDPTAPIVIKDSNPAVAGDQPLTAEFFNMSDILRKLYRQGVDNAGDIDLGNNFAKRSLYELLIIHQLSVVGNEWLEAIGEDLGFQEEQGIESVPMAADPFAGRRNDDSGVVTLDDGLDENTEQAIEENLDQFLRQAIVNVKVSRKHPDDTSDIRDLLAQIGRFAAEAAGNKINASPENIQAIIDAARAAIKVESGLNRLDVREANTAGRNRQKK